ncbi:DoxX family protein [Planomicrobium sp. CPCC 101110]|uniref:DoxX family protein n=1 Tax=Planomicrobium sp. CPCC 101110 TaxID=2599619 RepID=UPI0011B7A401|nr:DoxX family protein [Planomicrobium sp. CPCC 101110]TWT27263.1 DoxX family protein [Planomicrobium sp. CPCC 101110]
MQEKLAGYPIFLQNIFRVSLTVMIAFVMFSHGTQKLFGWFGGMGIQKTADVFASLGLTPAQPMVILAGVFELIFALGILIPKTRIVAGLGMVLFMAFAGIQSYEGKWFQFGGYGWEFALLFILSTFVIITLQVNEKTR